MRRIATVALAGSAIEWYDFFIYAAASALVFNKLFFPTVDGTAGTLLAFSTFAVGFLVRPLGAAVFGHFGDRFGRKPTLVVAMMLMGVATLAIGLLPTYSSVGLLAPILLVVLRLLQGLALGGQWGGAVLLATENAPPGKRGFYGGFAQLGVPIALIISNVIFLALAEVTAPDAFLSWGWRIPFLLSVLLIGVGIYAQRSIEDHVPAAKTGARSPFVELLRTHPREILLAAATSIVSGAAYYLLAVYSLSYATTALGVPRPRILTAVLISAVASGIAIPVLSALSDRIGRQRSYQIGTILLAAWALPLFWLLDTGSAVLMTLALVIGQIIFSLPYGALPALLSESFGTGVRYTGVALGYQIGAVLGGAFAPIIATALFAAYGSSTPISVYLIAVSAISFVGVILLSRIRPERPANPNPN
ncbi:MFS transporter [Pseudonocardia sp. N23]|uniref:MFS transporter n=1 Tax=Pseudonocardia sp. N23 TaxID=1987376 RepID=UPI000BFE17F4|nr:MFS transporter [Pseudonocardia sp. N23]GAY08113.1 permease of the major facilitator superfamily [Pseudonocardia sp. N23]